MKSTKFILILLSILLLLFIVSANAITEKIDNSLTEQNNKIKIINISSKPTILKYDGVEELYYKPLIKDTEICFIYKDSSGVKEPAKIDIYTSKNKLQSEQISLESKGGSKEYCVPYKEYIQLGNKTIIIENQTTKQVLFSLDGENNISVSLYWDVYGDESDYSNSVNDLFVYYNSDKYKFGAYHNNSVWERYKYVFNSSLLLIKKDKKYYYTTSEYLYHLNFEDICSKTISNGSSANCNFKIVNNTLEVTFWSDSIIDPYFIYSNNIYGTLLTNLTFESDTIIHLNISNTAPYDSLIMYMPFNTNASQTIVYDYSNHDIDGTINNSRYTNIGNFNGGHYFNDVNTSIYFTKNTFNTQFNNASGLTFTGWIYPNSIKNISGENINVILSLPINHTSDGFGISLIEGDGIKVSGKSNISDSTQQENITSVLSTNQWQHIAGVLDFKNKKIQIYVNGVMVKEGTGKDFKLNYYNNGTSTSEDTIGSNTLKSSTSIYNGTLDEIMIFNKSLSSTEISEIYENQSERFIPQGFAEFLPINIINDNKINISIPILGNNKSSALYGSMKYWNLSYGYNISLINDLRGHWSLDDGTFIDSLGISNGTIVDNYSNTTGRYDGGTKFNTSVGNGRVDIAYNSNLEFVTEVTLALWVLGSTSVKSEGLFGKAVARDIAMTRTASQYAEFYITNSSNSLNEATSTTKLTNTSKWYFLTGTYDGNYLKIYVDGVLEKTETVPRGTIRVNTNTYHIGYARDFTNVQVYANSSIDDVMVFNRSLTDDEIKFLYINGLAKWQQTSYTQIRNSNNVTIRIENNMTLAKPVIKLQSGTDNFYSPYFTNQIIFNSGYSNCTPLITNTSWSDWRDIESCQITDNKTQERNLTEYDSNFCGENENTTYYEYQGSSCDYCSYNATNTSWSSYINLSCSGSNMNQSRNLTQYDSNYSTCYAVTGLPADYLENQTFYEYQLAEPIYVNTSWSEWVYNESCQIDDSRQIIQNLTQYDSYYCAINITYYNLSDEVCDYCSYNATNTSWSEWYANESCRIDDLYQEIRNLTQYDSNYSTCYAVTGLPTDYLENQTFYDSQDNECNYCSYNVTNTSWSFNSTISCMINDTKNDSYHQIEYDSNYSTCYAVTGLLSDLWNSGNNITHIYYEYNESCDNCTPLITNTSWSSWYDITDCYLDQVNQSRNLTQYDFNFCYDLTNLLSDYYENITYLENQTAVCDSCIPNLTNTSWSSYINLSCSGSNMNQSRNLTQYDSNYCNEIENVTFYDYQLASPIYVNTSWGDWFNISCLSDDTMNQSRNLTQYDSYGCAENFTFIEYNNNEYCDFCTPNLTNTSWSEWTNTTCQSNNTMLQERYLVQYDNKECNEVENVTFYDYQYDGYCKFIGVKYWGIKNSSLDIVASISNTGTLNLSGYSCLGNICINEWINITHAIWNRTNSNTILSNSNDNVGIGTTTPTSKLTVNGNANIIGNINITGNIYVGGCIYVSCDTGCVLLGGNCTS